MSPFSSLMAYRENGEVQKRKRRERMKNFFTALSVPPQHTTANGKSEGKLTQKVEISENNGGPNEFKKDDCAKDGGEESFIAPSLQICSHSIVIRLKVEMHLDKKIRRHHL